VDTSTSLNHAPERYAYWQQQDRRVQNFAARYFLDGALTREMVGAGKAKHHRRYNGPCYARAHPEDAP
jgi:hypothetical protein